MLGAYIELVRYNYAYYAIGNSTDDKYKNDMQQIYMKQQRKRDETQDG